MSEIKKLVICLMILSCLAVGWFTNELLTVDEVNTECLLDSIETLMKEDKFDDYSKTYGKGIVSKDWTIEQMMDFYWFKHPKTRWGIKLLITHELKKCQT